MSERMTQTSPLPRFLEEEEKREREEAEEREDLPNESLREFLLPDGLVWKVAQRRPSRHDPITLDPTLTNALLERYGQGAEEATRLQAVGGDVRLDEHPRMLNEEEEEEDEEESKRGGGEDIDDDLDRNKHGAVKRVLGEGFERWRDHVGEKRKLKPKALKVVSRLMRVVQRVMSRALGDGWERWRETWQRQKRFRTKAVKALDHIVHRAMSKTVNSWQKATASNKRLGVRISRTLARLQSRTVRRAFEAWYPRMLKEDDQEEEASTSGGGDMHVYKLLRMINCYWGLALLLDRCLTSDVCRVMQVVMRFSLSQSRV